MKRFLLLLVVIITTTTFTSLETSHANQAVISTSQKKICKIKKECLSATTEANFKILNQVCNKRDESALKEMIAAGKVYILNPSMAISMVDYGFAKCKIYVANLKTEVWVSTEFVEYK